MIVVISTNRNLKTVSSFFDEEVASLIGLCLIFSDRSLISLFTEWLESAR